MKDKKRIVVAKLTRLEAEVFKSTLLTRQGLMVCLGLLEKTEREMWGKLKKEYKAPKDKTLAIDHRTRELYYEDFY